MVGGRLRTDLGKCVYGWLQSYAHGHQARFGDHQGLLGDWPPHRAKGGGGQPPVSYGVGHAIVNGDTRCSRLRRPDRMVGNGPVSEVRRRNRRRRSRSCSFREFDLRTLRG